MSKFEQLLFSLNETDKKVIKEKLKEKDKENEQLKQQLEQANEIINNPNTLITQQQEIISNLNMLIKHQQERAFRLYVILYRELEKQDLENVASRIDYMTSEYYSDICELYKLAKNSKQLEKIKTQSKGGKKWK